MIDIEKTKSAKEWILKLANGVNPLNNATLNDTEIVNDVHISRCLFYVAEVLDNLMRTRTSHQEKQYDCNFFLSKEDAGRVTLVEQTGIANFTRGINKVIPERMRPISTTQILHWLISAGYLVEVSLSDHKKTKQATDKGNLIGISSEWRESIEGKTYISTSYNLEAKKFILANINLMVK